jgi:endonuclease YncB( thermonuclease family)
VSRDSISQSYLKELQQKLDNDKSSRGTFSGRVKRVIDGDTFVLEGREQSVRLKGVNSPEMSEKPAGENAKKCLIDILEGQTVYIKSTEYQSASSRGSERIVAIVYSSDRNLVNAEVVRRGWAVPVPSFFDEVPYEDALLIDSALKYARSNKMGIWSVNPTNKLLEPFLAISPTNLDPIDKLEEYKRIPGATRIGTMWLYVPPAQITVTEHNSNIEWPTIRTAGSPRIRSTQQEQRIEMATIFPNLWSINYQLRPIIAQFIRSPFLPIENDHLRSILMPDYLTSSESIGEQLGQRAQEISKVGTLFSKQQSKEGKKIGENAAPYLSTSWGGYKNQPKSSSTKIDDRQLFAILRNLVIATIPGTPEALQATFTMTVFNYIPHMEKVEYIRTMPDLENQLKYLSALTNMRFLDTIDESTKNAVNNCGSTADVSNSEPFKRYYKTLLSETQIGQGAGPISWAKGLLPKLVPLHQGTMNKVKFVLPINTTSAEDRAKNTEEIGTLTHSVEEQLVASIRAKTGGEGIYKNTAGQLLKSASIVVKLMGDFVVNETKRSMKNLDIVLSDRDSFRVNFGNYMDSHATEVLTSIKSTQLTGASTAYDVLKAAVDGTILNSNNILLTMKRIIEIEQRNTIGQKETLLDIHIENNTQSVITGLSATFSPKVVTIPILDHLTPSAQFLGKSDWAVSMNMVTCDFELVRRLSTMSQLARTSQLAWEATDLRWLMVKLRSTMVPVLGTANGLFSFLGIGRVLFEDCVYESVREKPGWFNISLRMIQSDIDITEYEKLVPVNQLRGDVVRSITSNIASGTILPSKNKTIQRMLDSIKFSFKASMNATVSFTVLPITSDDIDELAVRPEVIGEAIRCMYSPDAWRTNITKLIEPSLTIKEEVFETMEGGAYISTFIEKRDATPVAFDERMVISRNIFVQGVHSAIISAIAIDPAGILEIYDPSLARASEKDRIHAIKMLTFSSDRRNSNPLHGCYSDMELPIYSSDPLLISPDFFYKKEERIAPEAVNFVRDRLNGLFDRAVETMDHVKAGKESGDKQGSLPGDLIADIRLYASYKELKDFPEISDVKAIDKVRTTSSKEIYDMMQRIKTKADPQSYFMAPSDEKLKRVIDELETYEYANVSAKEQVSMYRLFLAMKIAAIQDMIVAGQEIKEDSMTGLSRQRDMLLEEYNTIPKMIANGGVESIQNAWGIVTPSTIARSRAFLEKAAVSRVYRARSEEVSGSLARVFPTVKLYFVEEDPHEWQLFDDYYDYSSIRSVQVVEDKDTASKVATIQISNISQRLSTEKPGISEVPGLDQTPEEQYISSFVLREGVTIMIKMGYSNDPLLLETKFMGKVISSSPGDVIQVVAQSFGAELTSPIFEGGEGSHGYWGTARSYGDIITLAVSSMDGLDHFGNRNFLEMFRIKDPTFSSPTFEGLAYSNPKYRKWDYYTSVLNPIKKMIKFGVYDPRFENIYLPFSGNTITPVIPAGLAATGLLGSLGGGGGASGLMSVAGTIVSMSPTLKKALTEHATFDWYHAPNTTLWSLLQEMALYNEDYIVTTLPYDEDIPGWQRETVYVGPRNGYYKYTERFDDEDTASSIFKKNKDLTGAPTAAQKEAASYTIDIKNPDHLIDDKGNPLPGYAPVVHYHWVDSRHDIIENQITATAESLHNRVTIRYPNEPGTGDDKEFTVDADDNIKPGSIRHLIVRQPNIDPAPFEDFVKLNIRNPFSAVPTPGSLPARYTVSSNILANEMRKMYGGYIKIWGRPSIKPFDIVYINDMSNQMFGPIEVAQVIHDFNAESGFTTTIVPNSVVTVRNQEKTYHDIALNGIIIPYFNVKFYQLAAYVVDPLALLTGVALTNPRGLTTKAGKGAGRMGLAAAGALARKLPFVGSALEEARVLGKTLVGGGLTAIENVTGKLPSSTKIKALKAVTKGRAMAGTYMGEALFAIPQVAALIATGVTWSKSVQKVMGRDIINITGLWYNGNPMVAGMEGAYKDGYRTHFMDYVSSLFTFSTAYETWKGSVAGE